MRTPVKKFLLICAVLPKIRLRAACADLPLVAAAGCAVVLAALIASSAPGREVPLLAPSQGQLPSDVATDDMTKLSLVDQPDLGGKVLRVERLAGDSFGDRIAKVTNWKQFITLKFAAINPDKSDLKMILSVKHRRTTSYPTRVDVPFTLKPGKNSVVLAVDEMLNVNGSTPDLEHVSRWYIACEGGQPSALYFGDMVLEGPEPAASLAGPGAVGGPPVAYRITGTIGNATVDLVAKPMSNSVGGPSAVKLPIKTDPARLARIRAAKMPAITEPVMFDTPEADAIVSALEILPPDNPFNQVIVDWPVHPNSDAMIGSIGPDKPLRYNPDMGYILVPENQPKVGVKLTMYPSESDPGPYPVPDNVPIEGWPGYYTQFYTGPPLTLDDVQRDKSNKGGDRHAIVVDPGRRMLYEFGYMKKTDAGWEAGVAAIFDLKTNKLRPVGWTSTDAAGLPLFPAVVRYDELRRGMVEHAMRVTVRKTRRAFVAPATHYASRFENEEYPRMGERLRLKQDFDISKFSPPVQAILKGLKKYGMFVADNGIEWAISVTPDPRIPNMHEELRKVPGSAFEVVVSPH
jgi:hypothetical protein